MAMLPDHFITRLKKVKLPLSNYFRATTLSNAVSSLASTGLSLTKVDEREKQAALEEEQARLKALKVGVCILCIGKNKCRCSSGNWDL